MSLLQINQRLLASSLFRRRIRLRCRCSSFAAAGNDAMTQ
jgi:hypothetical protein